MSDIVTGHCNVNVQHYDSVAAIVISMMDIMTLFQATAISMFNIMTLLRGIVISMFDIMTLFTGHCNINVRHYDIVTGHCSSFFFRASIVIFPGW